jgi:hypothetical protein
MFQDKASKSGTLFSFLFVRIQKKVFRFLNSFSQKPKLKQRALGPTNYNPYTSHFIHLPSTVLSPSTEHVSNVNHGLVSQTVVRVLLLVRQLLFIGSGT